MKDKLFSDWPAAEVRAFKQEFRPRYDGHFEHRRLRGVSFAWRHGAWKSIFKSHRIHEGWLEIMGQTGSGCMPGNVCAYAVVYHLGPLKLYFGPKAQAPKLTATQKNVALIIGLLLGISFLEWFWFHEALNAGYARRAAEAKK